MKVKSDRILERESRERVHRARRIYLACYDVSIRVFSFPLTLTYERYFNIIRNSVYLILNFWQNIILPAYVVPSSVLSPFQLLVIADSFTRHFSTQSTHISIIYRDTLKNGNNFSRRFVLPCPVAIPRLSRESTKPTIDHRGSTVVIEVS